MNYTSSLTSSMTSSAFAGAAPSSPAQPTRVPAAASPSSAPVGSPQRPLSWNARFQKILDMNPANPRDAASRAAAVDQISAEFADAVASVAKRIIAEAKLPNDERTIQAIGPMSSTYLHDKVTFYLFDSVPSKKAAGANNRAFHAVVAARFRSPLTIVLTYRGRRVLATADAPIDESTLVYGTADGGQTFHNENASFDSTMTRMAAILNLKTHVAAPSQTRLHTGADVQGHLGKDKVKYVLNLTRLFPPLPPDQTAPMTHSAVRLRPEFLRRWSPVPLNSDACSRYSSSTADNDELLRAGLQLVRGVIPQAARDLDADCTQPVEIAAILHANGVNLCLMGKVLAHVTSDSVKALLHIEMVGRWANQLLQHQWTQAEPIHPGDRPYAEIAVSVLNAVLGLGSEHADAWEKLVLPGVRSKFSLDKAWAIDRPDQKQLYRRMQQLCGVVVGRYTIGKDPLAATDVIEMPVRRKSSGTGLINDKTYLVQAYGGIWAAAAYKDDGEKLFKDELARQKEAMGDKHPSILTTLRNLSTYYTASGKVDEAESTLDELVSSTAKIFGEKSPEYEDALEDLATIQIKTGRRDKALEVFDQLLKLKSDRLGKDDTAVASVLYTLAQHQLAAGDPQKAEASLQRCVAIREQKLGFDDLEVAHALHHLGIVSAHLNNVRPAIAMFHRAMAIKSDKLGPDSNDVGQLHVNIANMHDRQGMFDAALQEAAQGLPLRISFLGADHPEIASLYKNMAVWNHELKKYSEAASLYLKSLNILEKTIGIEHPKVAEIYYNMALLYEAQKDKARALDAINKVHAAWTKALGKDHPETKDAATIKERLEAMP